MNHAVLPAHRVGGSKDQGKDLHELGGLKGQRPQRNGPNRPISDEGGAPDELDERHDHQQANADRQQRARHPLQPCRGHPKHEHEHGKTNGEMHGMAPHLSPEDLLCIGAGQR